MSPFFNFLGIITWYIKLFWFLINFKTTYHIDRMQWVNNLLLFNSLTIYYRVSIKLGIHIIFISFYYYHESTRKISTTQHNQALKMLIPKHLTKISYIE